MIAAVNTGLFVPGLIVGIIIGFICMRAATTFQARYGRPPWGVPGWGWFLIGFILGLIGLVLYLIAHATSKRQAAQAGYYPPPAYPPPPTPQQEWSQQTGSQRPPPVPPPPPQGAPPPYPNSGPAEQPPPPG